MGARPDKTPDGAAVCGPRSRYAVTHSLGVIYALSLVTWPSAVHPPGKTPEGAVPLVALAPLRRNPTGSSMRFPGHDPPRGLYRTSAERRIAIAFRRIGAGQTARNLPSFEAETAIFTVSALKSGAIWLVDLKAWLAGRGAWFRNCA
jgi:hypothetical protein